MPYPTKWYSSAMQGAPAVSGTAGVGIAWLDAVLLNGFGTLTLDSLVVSGGVATATKSAGHAYLQWSVVEIAGATPSGLNGDKRVLSVSGTTFTFDATGISDQTASGTITAKVPGLGWTKAFSGTNKAAYQSQNIQSTGGLLRVDDSGTTDMRVRGFMTMSDVDTGTDPHPTVAQIADPGEYQRKSTAASSTPRSWVVIGDDLGFYVSVNVDGAANWRAGWFGDPISYMQAGDPWFCVCAFAKGSPSSVSSYLAYNYNISTGGCFAARSYTGVAGAKLIWGHGLAGTYSGTQNDHAYPSPVFGGLVLARPATIKEDQTNLIRGAYPGAAVVVNDVGNALAGQLVQVDGFDDRQLMLPDISDTSLAISIEAWR